MFYRVELTLNGHEVVTREKVEGYGHTPIEAINLRLAEIENQIEAHKHFINKFEEEKRVLENLEVKLEENQ